MENILIQFFKSRNVKIFPCSHRGNYGLATTLDPASGTSSQSSSIKTVFDPESRMLSEYNITSKPTNLFGKKNRVVEVTIVGELLLLKLVINGYYFEISLDEADLSNYFGIDQEIISGNLNTIINALQGIEKSFYIYDTVTTPITGYNQVEGDMDLDRVDSERKLHYLGSLLQLRRAKVTNDETTDTDTDFLNNNFGIANTDGYVSTYQHAGLDIDIDGTSPYYCVAIGIGEEHTSINSSTVTNPTDKNLVYLISDLSEAEANNKIYSLALDDLNNWYGVYYADETLNISFY